MDISLDRTIVLPHCIFILFASLCLRGLVLAFIGMKAFRYSIMSGCPFNMVLASTESIVYCRLDCRVIAGRHAGRALTNRDFALLNDKDFLFTEHGHGKLFGESLSQRLSDCCQSCCQRASVRAAVVRVAAVRVAAVRGLLLERLLSERLFSEWLLSEWLLSEWLLSESQSGWSAVKVSD
jgi:hypothetical protein